MLSCSCEFDSSYYDEWWEDHSDFTLLEGKRAKRCCSCHSLIPVGSEIMKFYRYRNPKNNIEEKIYEAVPLAPYVMCEECAGLYLALEELGYGCLDVTQPMRDYVAEYNMEE